MHSIWELEQGKEIPYFKCTTGFGSKVNFLSSVSHTVQKRRWWGHENIEKGNKTILELESLPHNEIEKSTQRLFSIEEKSK